MRVLVHVTALLAGFAVAPAALANPSMPTPSAPEMAPPPRAAEEQARPAEPAVHFVVNGGFDAGSTKLVEATLSDGSTPSIRANQGLNAALGIAFLKLGGGRFATQATIGIEGWNITASNADIRWRAFPLEVLEFVYLDPVRLGAGLSYLLSPSLKGDGDASSIDVEFENSPGLVLQADWVFRLARNSRAGRVTLGARYVIQDIEPKAGGPSIGANSLGFLVGFTG